MCCWCANNCVRSEDQVGWFRGVEVKGGGEGGASEQESLWPGAWGKEPAASPTAAANAGDARRKVRESEADNARRKARDARRKVRMQGGM